MKNRAKKTQQLLVLSVVTILLVLLFSKLSLWQWHRYRFKQSMQREYQMQNSVVPHPIDIYLTHVGERILPQIYQHVKFQGHYLEKQYLLDNQTELGQIGFAVITPFELDSGQVILINRGFVPADIHRHIRTPLDISIRPVVLTGLLTMPSKSFLIGGKIIEENAGWPKKIMRVDPMVLSGDLQHNLLPYIILLDPQDPSGFSRKWSPPNFWAERSLGYCFQWLALALLTLVFYGVIVKKFFWSVFND